MGAVFCPRDKCAGGVSDSAPVRLQGSLVANLLMGMVVLKRFYPRHKYAAVALITVGIILSTWASQVMRRDII